MKYMDKLRMDVQCVRPDMLRLRLRPAGAFRAEEKEMVVAALPRLRMSATEDRHWKHLSTALFRLSCHRQMGAMVFRDSEGRIFFRTAGAVRWESREGKTELRKACFTLSLRKTDHVYGFGMSAAPLDARGRTINTWISHFGADDYRTPYFWCSAGYSLFLRTARQATFRVGGTASNRLLVEVDNEEEIEIFLQVGAVRACLTGYTWLTGRSPMLPDWAFGHWLGGYWKTQKQLLGVARELRRRGIPTDVMRLDSCWQGSPATYRHECDFRWDRNYPQPRSMMRELTRRGFKLHLWSAHVVNHNCANFADGLARNVFLKNRDASVPLIQWWKKDRGCMIDFTSKKACRWWQSQLVPLLQQGVAGFKTDGANEACFVTRDRLFSDGRTGEQAHNIYPLLYARCVTKGQRAVYRKYMPIWIRAGYAGIQRYPVLWAGDQPAVWNSILAQIRAGISAGLSGVSFWSSDGGGFAGRPDEELYIRGIQFAFWNPICQPFGSDREPWRYTRRACRIFAFYARLRSQLHPYLVRLARNSTRTGLPMMRAMLIEYPRDPVCATLDDQYMLGPAFLVAPVYRKGGVRRLYLPAGRWADIYNGSTVDGCRWITVKADIRHIPVFVRCGVSIPVQEVMQYIGEKKHPRQAVYRCSADGAPGVPLTEFLVSNRTSNKISS